MVVLTTPVDYLRTGRGGTKAADTKAGFFRLFACAAALVPVTAVDAAVTTRTGRFGIIGGAAATATATNAGRF